MNFAKAGLPTLLVAVLLPQPAAARDLKQIAELPHRSRVLIDQDSLAHHRDGGRSLRSGVISIDNSLNPAAAADAYASDSKVEADCAAAALRIVWTRVYNRDGKLVRLERPGSLEEFGSPRSEAERAALEALCPG